MKSDQVYLRHILEAIEQIDIYVAGMSKDDFFSNRMAQDAVIRQLAIIGEAARLISDSLRQSCPGIPWANIVGMRNILIHDYMGVDIGEVWRTVEVDLPELRRQVESILQC